MQHSAADRDRSPLRQTAFCVAGPLMLNLLVHEVTTAL